MLLKGRTKYVDYFLLDGVKLTDNPVIMSDIAPAKNVEYKKLYDGRDVRIVDDSPTTDRRTMMLGWNKVDKSLYERFYRLYLWDTAFYITLHVKSVESDVLEPQRNASYVVDYVSYRGMYKNWLDDPVPVLYRNGVEIVSGSGYSVVSASGAVVFDAANPSTDEITADYSYRMKVKIDEMPEAPLEPAAVVRENGTLKQKYTFSIKLAEVD